MENLFLLEPEVGEAKPAASTFSSDRGVFFGVGVEVEVFGTGGGELNFDNRGDDFERSDNLSRFGGAEAVSAFSLFDASPPP
jgi:hypothetical protein